MKGSKMFTKYVFISVALCFGTGVILLGGCSAGPDPGIDDQVTTRGAAEVTARLVEILSDFPPNKLYDYVYVMKYEVLETHRGGTLPQFIYVGHYNPLKPRNAVVDKRVEDIGGNLQSFKPGEVHRMALESPLDDYFMGGVINEYGTDPAATPVYWAVWTNQVRR